MPRLRVVLADDHTLVRAGIRALLQSIADVDVVDEVGDGHALLRSVAAHQPDLAVIDIAMPGLNGLEATAQITAAHPVVRVIILSMYANEEYVWQALRAGAAAYLLKDADIAELEIAISAVARGETYLSPAISKQVVADYIQRVGGEGGSAERLTPRQREVLRLIASGDTTQEIARKLGISTKTVESHRSQLMDRLDIHDVAGLVRYAIRTGLIEPDN